MNPQISFSAEDIKDNLSTPKFPKNQPAYLIEKEENTLDTLKQQIDKVYNDKDTLNNENINESKNEKNILENSLANSLINLELNNLYINQFSFDEKSSNFLSKREDNDIKENKDNNNNKQIIIIEEDDKSKNNDEEKNNNNEKEEEDKKDNEIKCADILTNEGINKNEDNHFDYELPLDSDSTPEFFKTINFPENNETKKETNKKKSEKNLGTESCPNFKEEIYSDEKFEKIHLTPEKNIKNKIDKIKNKIRLTEIGKNILKGEENQKDKIFSISKCNTSNKKSNLPLKLPKIAHHRTTLSQIYLIRPSNDFMKLLEEDETEQNNLYSERNNNKSQNSNTNYNSLKNTNFNSNDIIIKKYDDKDNSNNNELIKPFTIDKSNDKNNNKNNNLDKEENINQNSKIKSNIIKDITLSYYNKRNRRNRNSMNFIQRNNNNFLNFNTETDKSKIIYEKNLIKNDSRTFTISQNENQKHVHSRNYKELNNNINNGTVASSNYLMNKRLKNSVILLNKNKNPYNEYMNNDNSLKNMTLYEYENFSQRSIDKNVGGKTERCSPFRKSKIRDSFTLKASSYKKYILNRDKLNEYNNSQSIINNTMKNLENTDFNGYNIFENIEEIKKEKYIKNKISKNIINNNDTNNMNFIKNQIFKNKGNLTQRNKDIGPANIYSKKIIFIPNGNNNNNANNNEMKINYQSKLKQYTSGYINNKNKTLTKNEINKSYIIPKEKNIKILSNEKSYNINKNKDDKNYKEYFNEIFSNININKSLTKTNLFNNNNAKQKNQNEKHKIRNIIQLSNLGINTMKTKTIQATNQVKNKNINIILNKINNNKIKNNNYIKNQRINNTNNLLNLTKSSKNLIEKFRNNILNYSIIRNNRNNQVKNEVSIFIGDNNKKIKKIFNEKKNKVNNMNNSKNNKINQLNKNKKTIINDNIFKFIKYKYN